VGQVVGAYVPRAAAVEGEGVGCAALGRVPGTLQKLTPLLLTEIPEARRLAVCVCLARKPVSAFLIHFLPFALVVLFGLFEDFAVKQQESATDRTNRAVQLFLAVAALQ